MRAAILKRLDALEASLTRQTRKPIVLMDVDAFDPADRDAYFSGDDAVLTRYGFEPTPSYISAIVIGMHPERRDGYVDVADMDDEEFERLEQRREREDRRRHAEARERAQLEAIQAAQRDQAEQLPPAPGNAYTPEGC